MMSGKLKLPNLGGIGAKKNRRKRNDRSVSSKSKQNATNAKCSPYPFYDFRPALEDGSRPIKAITRPTTHLKLRDPKETVKHVPQEPSPHFQLLKHATKLENYLVSAPKPSVCSSLYDNCETDPIGRLSDGNGVADYSKSVQVLTSVENDDYSRLVARSLQAMQQPIREAQAHDERTGNNEDGSRCIADDQSVGLLNETSTEEVSLQMSPNQRMHDRISACASGPSVAAAMDASVYNSRVQADKIPRSIVPFHLLREKGACGNVFVMPLPQMQSSAAYDASSISRHDVVLVERWLSAMLCCVQQGSFSIQEKFEDIQRIYYMAFHELMRQTMVQCFERGQLLHQVWTEHVLVFENRVATLQHRVQELAELTGKLQEEVVVASAEKTSLSSSLKELQRTLESAHTVLDETRKERDCERENNEEERMSGGRRSLASNSMFDTTTLQALRDQKAEGGALADRAGKDSAAQDSARSSSSDKFLRTDALVEDLTACQERIDELEAEVEELQQQIPQEHKKRLREACTQTTPGFQEIVEAEARKLSMEALRAQTETQVTADPGKWRRLNTKISTVRMLTDSSMSINPEKWVIKQMNRILLERMSPNFEFVTQTMEQFVFDFYIRKYGLPSVAKKNIGILAKNTFHYRTHPTVGIFVRISRGQMDEEATDRFLNALKLSTRPGNIADIDLTSSSEHSSDHADDDDDDDDDSDDEDAKRKRKKKKAKKKKKSKNDKNKKLSSEALAALAKRLKNAYVESTDANVVFPEDDDGNPNWVSVSRCMEITQYLIPTIRQDDLDAIQAQLAAITEIGPEPSWNKIKPHVLALLARTPRVDRDVFLRLFTHNVLGQQRRQHDYFEAAFKAGDDNGDGVLELSEFQSIIQEIDPQKDLAEVTRMFTEAIQHPANNSGSEDAMSPHAFSIICRQHGLQKLLVENEDGVCQLKRDAK